MVQEVAQWLNEIKDLRQQLNQALESEEAAHASADNWRKRYETEAQQRRTEAILMQQTIDALRSEIDNLKNLPQPSSNTPVQSPIEQSVDRLQTVAELRAKLIEVWAEREQFMERSYRLTHDLKTEQTNHAQTRQSLTTALGDTVDMLNKLKSENKK